MGKVAEIVVSPQFSAVGLDVGDESHEAQPG